MKIYTRTGDNGETGIIGKRLKKSSTLIRTIGEIDELNASIGVCRSLLGQISGNYINFDDDLQDIQNTLFSMGAILAQSKIEINLNLKVTELESMIDKMDSEIEPLHNFIVPGGTFAASTIHLTRTICRRVERSLVELNDSEVNRFSYMIIFLNRLSDYLFTLARFVNKLEGSEEIIWKRN